MERVHDLNKGGIIRITVPLRETNRSVMEVLGFGSALQLMARKLKGNGRVFRGPDSVQIDLEGITREQINPWIGAYGQFLRKSGSSCNFITVVARPAACSDIIPGEYIRERLSRKLLFALPTGAYVISNLFETSTTKSRWVVLLTPRTNRELLWLEAIEKGVAQRTVSVVWSESDCELFQADH